MCGYLHGNYGSAFGFTGDGTCFKAFCDQAGQPFGTAKQINQSGHIIGAHIHHRAAAILIIKLRRGMPALMSVADHLRCCAYGPADKAIVNELTAGLDCRPHEGIRRSCQQKAFFLCQSNEFFSFFKGGSQRFFTVNMLSGQKSRLRGFIMFKRPCEVQDDFNILILKHFFHRRVGFGNSIFLLCLFHFFGD